MDEPLATIVELAARLPFTMSEEEEREAEGALEALSDDARFYGKATWTNPASTPPSVVRLVLKAANRHMKNYEGFTQSRAGDETVTWDNQGAEAGSAHFTDREQAQLKQSAGHTGLYSVPTQAWGTKLCDRRGEGWVPTDNGGEFQYYCSDSGPWCSGCGGCR